MADINVQKLVYNRDYRKVLNSQFSQLIKPVEENTDINPTVDDLFNLYNSLFYQIPKSGDTNSHQYIIDRSSDYLGLSQTDINGLLAEITALRQQLVDANNQINQLLQAQEPNVITQ